MSGSVAVTVVTAAVFSAMDIAAVLPPPFEAITGPGALAFLMQSFLVHPMLIFSFHQDFP